MVFLRGRIGHYFKLSPPLIYKKKIKKFRLKNMKYLEPLSSEPIKPRGLKAYSSVRVTCPLYETSIFSPSKE